MTYQELERAARCLARSNAGDAQTVARAAQALREGRASKGQIAHAKRLAKGVLPRRRA